MIEGGTEKDEGVNKKIIKNLRGENTREPRNSKRKIYQKILSLSVKKKPNS